MKTSIDSSRHTAKPRGMMTAIAAGVVFTLAGCASVPPPKEQMAVSQTAVENAINSDTTQFAPVELEAARSKLQQAEQAMAKKDYAQAKRLAEEAEVDARLAQVKARSAQSQKALAEAKAANDVLRQELQRLTNTGSGSAQ